MTISGRLRSEWKMVSSDRRQKQHRGRAARATPASAPIGRRMTDRQARIHRRASYARKPMIGIDIGKNSFHVVGHDGPAPAPKPSATAFCEPSTSCSRHHPRRALLRALSRRRYSRPSRPALRAVACGVQIACWHFPNSYGFGKNWIDVELANQLRFRKSDFQKEHLR